MSNDKQNMNDPLSFVRSLWSGMGVSMPGMVTPTFDVDELDKRIKDMKAVEGWLRMNLSMLQMTIQGLEMQRTTLGAVQAMSQMASDAAKSMKPEATAEPVAVDPAQETISGAAMWPWQMMQQMREQMQQSVEAAQAASEEQAATRAASKRARKSAG
jgi:outer membrane receptor for Fe3+-dicitrate